MPPPQAGDPRPAVRVIVVHEIELVDQQTGGEEIAPDARVVASDAVPGVEVGSGAQRRRCRASVGAVRVEQSTWRVWRRRGRRWGVRVRSDVQIVAPVIVCRAQLEDDAAVAEAMAIRRAERDGGACEMDHREASALASLKGVRVRCGRARRVDGVSAASRLPRAIGACAAGPADHQRY